MNLLHDEIEDIAERIKLRLLRGGAQQVYAKRSGLVAIYRLNDEANQRCADADRVGVYTSRMPVAEIEGDLRARLREIAA